MKNVDCGAAIKCVCFSKKKIKTLFVFVKKSFLLVPQHNWTVVYILFMKSICERENFSRNEKLIFGWNNGVRTLLNQTLDKTKLNWYIVSKSIYIERI